MRMNVTLIEIGRFCRKHNMSEVTFGRKAVKDGSLVSKLRNGRELQPKTVERIARFMETYDEG